MDAKEALQRINKLPENNRERMYAEHWLSKQVKAVCAVNPDDMFTIMRARNIGLRINVMGTKWYAQRVGAVGATNWNMYKNTQAEADNPLVAVQVSALLAAGLGL